MYAHLTERAIEGKVRNGVWLEDREYHRAPDGRIYVDLEAVGRWVRGSKK